MTNTAATYARYSTDEQDPRSIEDQIRRCKEFAKDRHIRVVHAFSDEAVSGSHTMRPQLIALLAQAMSKRPPFQMVLVDDLSRLSRNMGDFWRVIDDLAGAGIKVIDVQTGMASDDPNARAMFGMKSVFNDHYLQQVRYQTMRGLKGRAESGFWTGGRVYGYTTRPEDKPSDPEHPRAVPMIDEVEAVVVRRIFEMFIDGAGLKKITARLNDEKIPAPHDREGVDAPNLEGKGRRGHKKANGWTHNTVRNILRNERYIGRWTWNTTTWLPPRPGKKSRRRVMRPRSEWVVREYPDLAIIDMATWRRAEAQLRRRTESGGRPPGSGRHTYLLSGLLRCGVCEGPMSIIGGRTLKNGSRCVTFGCTTRHTRGTSECSNSLTISEKRITAALLESLRELFAAPDVVRRLTGGIAARVEKLAMPSRGKVTAGMISEVENRIRQLTETLAMAPASQALLQKLGEEERKLAELKAAKRTAPPPKSVKAPTAEQVRGYLADMVGTFEADPAAGRDALAEMISPLTLTPKTTPRGYECRAVFRSVDSSALVARPGSLRSHGSGGRI